MLIAETRPSLDAMIARVTRSAHAPLAKRPGAVADALAEFVRDPDLLSRLDCPACPDRYIRHLLHADPEGSFAIVALVWRPGQMSPVHAHRTWCALGVHHGVLTESFYRPGDDGQEPAPVSTHLRHRGDCSHGPADPRVIHRLANLGCTNAVSIHVYGVGYERFGQDVNLILAP